jgi:hypothetical protein
MRLGMRSYEHFVGEVAQLSVVNKAILLNFAGLHKDDLVLVKRSDMSWTYALIKEKENGPNASVIVTVNSHGAFKKMSVHQCAKFLRKVVVDHHDDYRIESGSISTSLSSSTKTSNDVSTVPGAKELYYSHHEKYEAVRSTRNQGDLMPRLIGKLNDRCLQENDKPKCSKRPTVDIPSPSFPQIVPPSPTISLKSSIMKHRSLHDSNQNQPSQRHVTFNVNQGGDQKSFRLNHAPSAKVDKEITLHSDSSEWSRITRNNKNSEQGDQSSVANPQLRRQRSWSMEVQGMAEGILKIPKTKLEDLNMGEILPQNRRQLDGRRNSFPHAPTSNHTRSSKRSSVSLLLQHDKCFNVESSSVPRKKLNQLNMGETVPQSHGQAGFESFQHALQSIHKRSSVFLPPVSGGGVTLH